VETKNLQIMNFLNQEAGLRLLLQI